MSIERNYEAERGKAHHSKTPPRRALQDIPVNTAPASSPGRKAPFAFKKLLADSVVITPTPQFRQSVTAPVADAEQPRDTHGLQDTRSFSRMHHEETVASYDDQNTSMDEVHHHLLVSGASFMLEEFDQKLHEERTAGRIDPLLSRRGTDPGAAAFTSQDEIAIASSTGDMVDMEEEHAPYRPASLLLCGNSAGLSPFLEASGIERAQSDHASHAPSLTGIPLRRSMSTPWNEGPLSPFPQEQSSLSVSVRAQSLPRPVPCAFSFRPSAFAASRSSSQ